MPDLRKHQHACPNCHHRWQHVRELIAEEAYDSAHTCPKCGTEQFTTECSEGAPGFVKGLGEHYGSEPPLAEPLEALEPMSFHALARAFSELFQRDPAQLIIVYQDTSGGTGTISTVSLENEKKILATLLKLMPETQDTLIVNLETGKDAKLPAIKSVSVFANGMVAVFDHAGKQIPEYQGKWKAMKSLILANFKGEVEYYE